MSRLYRCYRNNLLLLEWNRLGMDPVVTTGDGADPKGTETSLATTGSVFSVRGSEKVQRQLQSKMDKMQNTMANELAQIKQALEDVQTMVKDYRTASSLASITCYACGLLGHISRNCPQGRYLAAREPGHGEDGGRGCRTGRPPDERKDGSEGGALSKTGEHTPSPVNITIHAPVTGIDKPAKCSVSTQVADDSTGSPMSEN